MKKLLILFLYLILSIPVLFMPYPDMDKLNGLELVKIFYIGICVYMTLMLIVFYLKHKHRYGDTSRLREFK